MAHNWLRYRLSQNVSAVEIENDGDSVGVKKVEEAVYPIINTRQEENTADDNKVDDNGETFNEEAENKYTKKEQAKDRTEDEINRILQTCPMDPRFPHVNQTYHCYVSYVDFQRCTRLLGDYEGCNVVKKRYKSLCPNAWVEQWDEQIENGTFPVHLPQPKEEYEAEQAHKEEAPVSEEGKTEKESV